jgi:hypothetical protein
MRVSQCRSADPARRGREPRRAGSGELAPAQWTGHVCLAGPAAWIGPAQQRIDLPSSVPRTASMPARRTTPRSTAVTMMASSA